MMMLLLYQQRLRLEGETENSGVDDDDVYHYIGERLELEGETENMWRLSEETDRHDSCST